MNGEFQMESRVQVREKWKPSTILLNYDGLTTVNLTASKVYYSPTTRLQEKSEMSEKNAKFISAAS